MNLELRTQNLEVRNLARFLRPLGARYRAAADSLEGVQLAELAAPSDQEAPKRTRFA
jgi:hypothetical protein